MRASLKGKTGAGDSRAGAASFGVPVGDFKLRASITEATLVNGPSLNGLALSVEKPGSFIIDYDVPRKVTSKPGPLKFGLELSVSLYCARISFI